MFKKMFENEDALGACGILLDSLFSGLGNCFEGLFGGIARICGK